MNGHEEVMSADFRDRLRSELVRGVREEGRRSARRRVAMRVGIAVPTVVLAVAVIGSMVTGDPAPDAAGPARESTTTGICVLPEVGGSPVERQIVIDARPSAGTDRLILDRCAELWRDVTFDVVELQSSGGEKVIGPGLVPALRLCVDEQGRRVAGAFPSCETVGMGTPR